MLYPAYYRVCSFIWTFFLCCLQPAPHPSTLADDCCLPRLLSWFPANGAFSIKVAPGGGTRTSILGLSYLASTVPNNFLSTNPCRFQSLSFLLLSRWFIFLLLSTVSLNPNQHLGPFLLDLNCPQQLSILCSPKCSVLAVSISIILLYRWFTFLSN